MRIHIVTEVHKEAKRIRVNDVPFWIDMLQWQYVVGDRVLYLEHDVPLDPFIQSHYALPDDRVWSAFGVALPLGPGPWRIGAEFPLDKPWMT